MPPVKAYILDRFANRNPNYTSWIADCPVPIEIVDAFGPTWKIPADAGIVITHLHYRWEDVSTLRRIVQTGITPVLVLSDGLLEYRNTWQNPNLSDGSIFQPLIGHKLACVGRGQTRVVECWGNVGKCETVGLPRLDELVGNESLPLHDSGPFRLLVATANTPAFDEKQREQVIHSLRDLKRGLDNNPWAAGRPIEVQWRLTDGLDSELGFNRDAGAASNEDAKHKRRSLTDAIEHVDAVITTPSTLYFESVIQRRPTAVLDYTNSPQYVPSAWNITAERHLRPTLEELAAPPAAKLQFQRASLHDQLECATPAKPRLLTLIQAMIESGVSARKNAQPLNFPQRILSDPQRGMTVVESEFNHAILFPDNPAFQQSNVAALQIELSQAITRLRNLPAELDCKNADVVRKDQHIADLNAHLEEAWERIADYREKESQHQIAMSKKAMDINKKSEHIKTMEQCLSAALSRVQELRSELDEVKGQPSLPPVVANLNRQRAA